MNVYNYLNRRTQMNRLVLIKPSIEYKDAIIEMLDEWLEYNATHKTDPSPRAIFHDHFDFDAYLKEFERAEKHPKPEHVPATTYFALDKERNIIVGAICIRHYLTEALLNSGGHIGDGVRPSERRKGYATEMIGLALQKCKEMNIDKVMMSCHKDNGGVYDQDIIDGNEILERYWINL